jgi:hypothetical protein
MYFSPKLAIFPGVSPRSQEKTTTLTMHYFLLMLAAISQLRSHEHRSDFKSSVMKIRML